MGGEPDPQKRVFVKGVFEPRIRLLKDLKMNGNCVRALPVSLEGTQPA